MRARAVLPPCSPPQLWLIAGLGDGDSVARWQGQGWQRQGQEQASCTKPSPTPLERGCSLLHQHGGVPEAPARALMLLQLGNWFYLFFLLSRI